MIRYQCNNLSGKIRMSGRIRKKFFCIDVLLGFFLVVGLEQKDWIGVRRFPAGQSAGFLISHLLAAAADENWFVTVGDRDHALAAECVGSHPCGEAIQFDASDTELMAAQVEAADVVLNFLPQSFQHALARACL